MERRAFIVLLTAAALAAPLAADAQPPEKVRRIGVLYSGSPPFVSHVTEAFRQGLRERGYVEGRNIAVEYRYAEERYERLPDLAAELVRLKADVIVAPTTPAARAAKQATATIPIVMVAVADPVGSGLVASVIRPGGNVTGMSVVVPELSGKNLQLLREVLPGITRVGVLVNPVNPVSAVELREIEVAARSLGLRAQLMEVRAPTEFERAFAAMVRERAGAVTVLVDAMFFSERKRMVDLAAKSRLPAIYQRREYVEEGGLMAFGPSLIDLFRRAAGYVDKLLKGARPGDLPIEQATKFELVVNLKTAKALGLTIPQSVLLRADQVIQ